MHSERHYKISVCSVILGQLEAFRNYKGFRVILTKILEAIERFHRSENFSYSSLHLIFEYENVRFPSLA